MKAFLVLDLAGFSSVVGFTVHEKEKRKVQEKVLVKRRRRPDMKSRKRGGEGQMDSRSTKKMEITENFFFTCEC